MKGANSVTLLQAMSLVLVTTDESTSTCVSALDDVCQNRDLYYRLTHRKRAAGISGQTKAKYWIVEQPLLGKGNEKRRGY